MLLCDIRYCPAVCCDAMSGSDFAYAAMQYPVPTSRHVGPCMVSRVPYWLGVYCYAILPYIVPAERHGVTPLYNVRYWRSAVYCTRYAMPSTDVLKNRITGADFTGLPYLISVSAPLVPEPELWADRDAKCAAGTGFVVDSEGLALDVWRLGFEVWTSGFEVEDMTFEMVWSLEFRVSAFGFRLCGTEIMCGAARCYAMSGNERAYGATRPWQGTRFSSLSKTARQPIALRASYALSGTEIAYGTMRFVCEVRYCEGDVKLATLNAKVISAISLRASHALSGTKKGSDVFQPTRLCDVRY
eukprot:571826-Rhodomonas_salina.2